MKYSPRNDEGEAVLTIPPALIPLRFYFLCKRSLKEVLLKVWLPWPSALASPGALGSGPQKHTLRMQPRKPVLPGYLRRFWCLLRLRTFTIKCQQNCWGFHTSQITIIWTTLSHQCQEENLFLPVFGGLQRKLTKDKLHEKDNGGSSTNVWVL